MPEQAQAASCRYLAARGGAALGRFGGGVVGGFLGPGTAAAGSQVGSWLGGAGGAALGAAWCPDADPGQGDWPISPQPRDGQCSTFYMVNFDAIGKFSGIQNDSLGNIRQLTGPIGAGSTRITPGVRAEWLIETVAGPTVVLSRGGASWSDLSIQINSITRADGLPDNCAPGGPPILPGVGTDIPPITSDPLARNTINVDIDFGGGIIIPISGELRISGPTISNNRLAIGFNFDGLDFNLFPNGTIEIGGGSDYPEIGEPPPDPEDTTNYEFTGVAYTVTNAANNQSFDQVEQGRFYYPRFGSISFKGKGLRSEQFPMHGQTGYILNPEPSLFSSFTFTPYRATNTADFLKVGKSNCCKVVSYTVSQ